MLSLGGFGTTIGVVFLFILFLLAVGLLLTAFYKRASKESAFVRTGAGGEKVIKDGGAIVIPRFHETQWVNMKTLKLDVSRKEIDALITKDRMRVDVTAEFFVRVAQDAESISKAAQTLGDKTNKPEDLRALVEGKFVDALRSVAASMSMKDLHEQRGEFVRQVQEAVTGDLKKNGLELEAVSLTRFDQTDRQFFNQNNVFDAEGLTTLTEQIELRKQNRNKIERETEVKIAEKDLEASRETVRINRENQQMKLESEREIEFTKNGQAAEIAKNNAEQTLIAEEARLKSAREVEQARMKNDREISLNKIQIETEVRNSEIEKERNLAQAKIKQEEEIKKAQIQQEKSVELSKQEKAIAIAEKSEQEASASASAEKAREEQVKASQAVITAEELSKANRVKEIQIIQAQAEAEKAAVAMVKKAEAELDAARKKAEALEIEAKARKLADELEAAGNLAKYKAQAEGERELNEAANLQSQDVRNMRVKLALFDKLPDIVAQTVKPLEKLDTFKIIDVGGLSGNGNGSGAGGTGNEKSLPEQVLEASLRGQVARPLITSLMGEVGLAGTTVMDAINNYEGLVAMTPTATSEKPVVASESAKVEEGAGTGEDLQTKKVNRSATNPRKERNEG